MSNAFHGHIGKPLWVETALVAGFLIGGNMKRKNTIIATVITCVILAAIFLYAVLVNRNDTTIDTAQKTNMTNKGDGSLAKSQREIDEYNKLPIVGYKISILNRGTPCVANYSVSKKINSPSGNVALDVDFFLESTFEDGDINILSAQANSIARESYNDAKVVNQKFKFGEITKEVRSSELDSIVASAAEKIDALKLSSWNSEVQRVRDEYNATITNGNLEDCFDRWIITSISANDYIDRKTLELYGN